MQSATADAQNNNGAPIPFGGRCWKPSIGESVNQMLLRASRKDCNDSRNRFIPRASLADIINIERVSQILQSVAGRPKEDADHLQDMAQDICPNRGACFCGHGHCTGRRMICAILLLCGRKDLILPLLCQRGSRVCDSDLPFSLDSLDHINHDLSENGKELSENEKEIFIHVQWQVYTPFVTGFYGENQEVKDFPDEVSLPWMSKARIGEPILGERSHVDQIEIYPCSHNLNDTQVFALKTFEPRLAPGLSRKFFQHEIDANLDAPKHDRVVRLLAAFTHRQRFYLLFPFANEGSLENLWKSYTPESVIQEYTQYRSANWYSDWWLISECLAITSALVATHGLSDSQSEDTKALLHADIKPENILCFRNSDPGQPSIELKLADFGEAKRMESVRPLKASKVAHVMTYRPPEHFPGGEVTLKYDVWCLGCLFLDFVTWAISGQAGIDAFRRIREDELDDPAVTENPGQLIEDIYFRQDRGPFLSTTLGHGKKLKVENKRATTRYSVWVTSRVTVIRRVKDGVLSHLRSLLQHDRCSAQLRQLLLFVGERMLVVDPEQRADSRVVHDFLKGIVWQ